MEESYMNVEWLTNALVAVPQAAALAAQAAALRLQMGNLRQPVVPIGDQLDGLILHGFLMRYLTNQLRKVFALPPMDRVWRYFEEEFILGFQLVMFKWTLWDTDQLLGDRLLNLQYRNEAAAGSTRLLHAASTTALTLPQKVIYGLCDVVVPYAMKRLSGWIGHGDESVAAGQQRSGEFFTGLRRALLRMLRTAERYWMVVVFLERVALLAGGKYRSVVDAALEMRLVKGKQQMTVLAGLDIISYQLRWKILFGALALILPLLRLHRLWAWLSTGGAASETLEFDRVGRDGVTNRCVACGAAPVAMPQRSNCGHCYCYACIEGRLQHAGHFACLSCGESVHCATFDLPESS